VIWIEEVLERDDVPALVSALRAKLERYGIREIALSSPDGHPPPDVEALGCLAAHDVADESDVLLNMAYDVAPSLVRRSRRSALVDIDPGLCQMWLAKGWLEVPPHDVYFTIGETVPADDLSSGLAWRHVPPPVAVEWWPASEPPSGAAFTTVSTWLGNEWVEDGGEVYSNDKRHGFMPYLDLPRRSATPLELALTLGDSEEELHDREALHTNGWRVRDAREMASAPWDYQQYISGSLGEFSCAKPSCVRLQNAWVSDRTLCYLASGRPAVVQHTGPSSMLPDREGMLRFRTPDEAVECLELAAADWPRQSRLARELVEQHFDPKRNLARALDIALDARPVVA
jgi:hypothetical protein